MIKPKNSHWKIVHACLSGQKHEHSQDFCYLGSDDKTTIMCLCDGASSSQHADIAAASVSRFSAIFFEKHFDKLYDADHKTLNNLLAGYHQDMLKSLSADARAQTGIEILVNDGGDTRINVEAFSKFCTTVQLLAVKDDRAIYFKVGNGSAVIDNGAGLKIFSESTIESPTPHVTKVSPYGVLFDGEFRTFNVDGMTVFAMATDGVEFDGGLLCNGHEIQSAYEELLKKISTAKSEKDAQRILEDAVHHLHNHTSNLPQDDISIAVMYRDDKTEPQDTGLNPYKCDCCYRNTMTNVSNPQTGINKATKAAKIKALERKRRSLVAISAIMVLIVLCTVIISAASNACLTKKIADMSEKVSVMEEHINDALENNHTNFTFTDDSESVG